MNPVSPRDVQRHVGRHAARRLRPSRGWALSELVVVVAIAAVVSGVSVPVVMRLWQANRELKAEFAWQRSVQRLAEQWRTDVPLASQIQSGAGSELVKLWMGRASCVTYSFDGRELVRTEQTDHRAPAYEGYSFPAGTSASFTMGPAQRTLQLSLKILHHRPPSSQPVSASRQIAFQIVAPRTWPIRPLEPAAKPEDP